MVRVRAMNRTEGVAVAAAWAAREEADRARGEARAARREARLVGAALFLVVAWQIWSLLPATVR